MKNASLFFVYQVLAIIILILLFPFLIILFLLIKLTSKGPFIFKQKRMGKDNKTFTIYKIRTMVENAESLKSEIYGLNEADGPVFKIENDPRYTKIGKYLAQVALDEIPQLFNVIKGEMSFVGPRPLPVQEAIKIPEIYQKRFSILPGITSYWVIEGAHRLSFKQWMEFDLEYVNKKSILIDVKILFYTALMIIYYIFICPFKKKSTSKKVNI